MIVKAYLEDPKISGELEKELAGGKNVDTPELTRRHYRYRYFKKLEAVFQDQPFSARAVKMVQTVAVNAGKLALLFGGFAGLGLAGKFLLSTLHGTLSPSSAIALSLPVLMAWFYLFVIHPYVGQTERSYKADRLMRN